MSIVTAAGPSVAATTSTSRLSSAEAPAARVPSVHVVEESPGAGPHDHAVPPATRATADGRSSRVRSARTRAAPTVSPPVSTAPAGGGTAAPTAAGGPGP